MKKIITTIALVLMLTTTAYASWFSRIIPSFGGHNKHNYHNSGQQSDGPQSVPEPATLILLGGGIVVLAGYKRWRGGK